MKNSFTRWAGVTALSLSTFAAYAADNERNYPNDRIGNNPDNRSSMNRLDRFAFPAKANELLGREITNLQDEKVGKVEEIGLDLESGRVVQVIVSSGGIFGIGGKSWAVPPGAFSYDPGSKSLRLDVDKERYKSVSAFDMSKWDDSVETNHLSEVYRSYGQRPYFNETPAARVGKPATMRLGKVDKASKVVGLSVMNRQNEKLGSVDNLIIDLPAGRIVHVVLSSGGFLGMGDALSAVPPSAFTYSASQDSLVLDATKDKLAGAPNFKSAEWPNFNDPAYAGKVYRSYNIDPYFSTDADNTARNVRDRQESRLTPIDQGTSEADVETTRSIRKEILAVKNLSVNARNVKVITLNGRVTLRGPVGDELERKTIADIANRIAREGNVDNQLEATKLPYKDRE